VSLRLADPVTLPEPLYFDNGFAHHVTMHQELVLAKVLPKLCLTRARRVREKTRGIRSGLTMTRLNKCSMRNSKHARQRINDVSE
jgi:hypothetical protein